MFSVLYRNREPTCARGDNLKTSFISYQHASVIQLYTHVLCCVNLPCHFMKFRVVLKRKIISGRKKYISENVVLQIAIIKDGNVYNVNK